MTKQQGGTAQSAQTVTRLQAARPRYRGSIPGRGNRFLISPKHPDRIWGPPSLIFRQVQSGRGVRLTTNLQITPRIRMSGVIPPLPPCTSKTRTRTTYSLPPLVVEVKVKRRIQWSCRFLVIRAMINTKIKIYRTVILFVVLHGCETWSHMEGGT